MGKLFCYTVATRVRFAAIAASLFLAACGSQSVELDRQLQSMQADLVLLRSENDHLEERLAGLEAAGASRPQGQNGTSDANFSAPPRPVLKVVTLEPGNHETARSPGKEAAAEEPAGQNAEPRPLIRGQGDRIEAVAATEVSDGHSSRRAKSGNLRQTLP
jgi:hypothetical protein